ncbi:MAG: sulfatase [Pseudomonadota bacterium]
MRCVFVMFDSLNRRALGPYGGKTVPTPNFDRLAKKAVTFDKHYIGSMPCMPARRDLQTGRLSFLHRSWGPLEPFDNSVPELLAEVGVYSHLITDHAHYFEDGGATYHNRYSSWEFIRGQEGDPWKGVVEPDRQRFNELYHDKQTGPHPRNYFTNNMINRDQIKNEADFPSVQCFARGLEFLETNRDADNWLLQIETFDPHEPFTAPERLKERFKTGWNGPIRDWPPYARVTESDEEADEMRANYNALLALCDELLGELLDYFDAHDLWKDTALILSTDHGYLLGEHDFWAKNRMHTYQELANIPLFVHHPAHAGSAGQRRAPLTQNIDLAATFIDMFDAKRPMEMQGFSLLDHMDEEQPGRDAVIFGYFGGAVNITDGRYTYHCYPNDLEKQEVYQYTLMPTHIWQLFSTEELAGATLSPPLPFTKNCPILRIPVLKTSPFSPNMGPLCLLESQTTLFDLDNDPAQEKPLQDAKIETRLRSLMARLMAENDAPDEAFKRLELRRSSD